MPSTLNGPRFEAPLSAGAAACLGGKQAKVGNGVYYTGQAHKHGHAVRLKCTQNALKVLKQFNENRLTTSGAAAALSAGAAACLGGRGSRREKPEKTNCHGQV